MNSNNNKKKILIVSSKLYPETVGGLHRASYSLIKRLSKCKDVDLHILSEKPKNELLITKYYDNINFHLIKHINKENVLTFFLYQFLYFKKLRTINSKFDVIHYQTLPGGKFFLSTFLSKTKTNNLILTIQDWPMMEMKYQSFRSKIFHYFHWILTLIVLNRFDQFIVSSKFSFEKLKKYINHNSISIVRIGFDINIIKNLLNRKFKKKLNQICYFGALTKKKGVMDLLNSFYLLSLVDKRVILKIAGSGPLNNRILSFIDEKKLNDKVKLYGFLSEKEKIRFIQESELAVFPSKHEGFGIAILESLLCKTKVITSNFGGQVDFKNDFSNLYLYQRNDINDLTHKMFSCLRKDINLKKFKFKRYDIDIIFNDYKKIYKI